MRLTLLIFILLLQQNSQAQHHLYARVLDSITHEPLPETYVYIYRGNDKWIDIDKTDSAGYFKGTIDEEEFRADEKYHFVIPWETHKPVFLRASVGATDTAIIYLSKASDYIQKIRDMIYIDCSSISFGYYAPKEPRSFNDLPPLIQQKVREHLIARVGEKFYSSIMLTGGQIVDLQRLDEIEHFKREYHWKVYPYYLCLSFIDTAAGIARYTTKLTLNQRGKVIEDVDLPFISKDSKKNFIMSVKNASLIAKQANSYNDSSYHDFKYDYERDCFVWIFISYFTTPSTDKYTRREIHIAAHDGKIVKEECFEGLWRYRHHYYYNFPLMFSLHKLSIGIPF